MSILTLPKRKRIWKPPVGRAILDRRHQLGDPVYLGLFNEGSGGEVFDLSGNNNTGSLVADTHFVPGKFGSALYFDGTGAVVNVGTRPSLDLTNGHYTIIAWIKRSSTQIDTYPNIYIDGGWRLSFGLDSPNWELDTFINNGSQMVGNTIVPADIWCQVGLTGNGTNRSLWLNGKLDKTGAIAAYTNPADVGIGARSDGAMEFTGFIDNIIAYNRALSASEIALLYREPFGMITTARKRAFLIVIPAVGGQNFIRTVDDSLGITDVETEVKEIIRTFDESMGVVDDREKIHVAIRTVAESMGITDTTDGIKGIIRTVADSIGITDAEARVIVFVRTIAESMGITDTTSRIQEVYRVIAESMGITDSMTRIALVERIIADTLGITDDAEALKELLKVINDSVGLTDDVTRICLVIRTVAESMGLTDVDTRVWEAVRTVAESIGITDIMDAVKSGGQDFIKVFNNVMGMTDATSKTHIALRVLSENLGLTDSVVKILAISRLVSDSMGITDGVVLGRLIEVVDNLGITDDVTRLINYIRTQDDDIGLIDAMVRVATISRTINDALGLTDIMAAQLGDLTKAVWAFIILKKTK